MRVLSVNPADEAVEPVDRRLAHTYPGIRHRAFLIMVFASDRILLAKRSPRKRGWPGFWDGTVASHPGPTEPLAEASIRRLQEELNLPPEDLGQLNHHFWFEYQNRYDEEYVEWEVCHFYTVQCSRKRITPASEEISDYRWLHQDDLEEFLQTQDRAISPWLLRSHGRWKNSS
jgi:isopentenyl-diphosphate delta-isomerase